MSVPKSLDEIVFTTGVDPETTTEVALFNPRQQQWSDHFIWSTDALQIIGKTPTGRATCNRLDLNDERREEPFIQNARQQWVAGGYALHRTIRALRKNYQDREL